MAGNKKQAEQVVAEILFVGCVEFGFKICHGGFLLGAEFAAELFVFALEKLAPAKMIERAMLGSSHQPGSGIVGYTAAWPLFESGDQSVLRKFFGQANIANDPRKPRDNSRRFNAPHGVNRAMCSGSHSAGCGFGGHGDPFHW